VDGSLAVLPVGVPENPKSKYYRNQQVLWQKGKLRPAPLSRSEVEKNSSSIVELKYK